MKFDPGWWLTGTAAEHAALEDTGSKDVPNDVYTLEEGHRLLTFTVLRTARINVLTAPGVWQRGHARAVRPDRRRQEPDRAQDLRAAGRLLAPDQREVPEPARHDRPAVPAVAHDQVADPAGVPSLAVATWSSRGRRLARLGRCGGRGFFYTQGVAMRSAHRRLRLVSGAPMTGGCPCGGVRWELTQPPVGASYCHCTRCQRRTGTRSIRAGARGTGRRAHHRGRGADPPLGAARRRAEVLLLELRRRALEPQRRHRGDHERAARHVRP